MRVPQLNERVKEAPAHALRAMFAGIGQLLLVTDRLRNRAPDAEQHDEAPANGTPPEETVPATPAAQEPAIQEPAAEPAPAAEMAQAAEPEPAAGPVRAPESAPAPAPAEPAPGAGLPLPNYDELTIPSLRARLRNLSAAQLRDLIEYESSHAAREDVVAMFERRIAKIEA